MTPAHTRHEPEAAVNSGAAGRAVPWTGLAPPARWSPGQGPRSGPDIPAPRQRTLRTLVGMDPEAAAPFQDVSGAHSQRVRRTEKALARLWGADHAFALPAGGTSGAHALLLAATTPGESVVIARDADLATHAALIASGVHPIWISPRVDPRTGLGTGLSSADLAAALAQSPHVRTALVTSPSYAGTCTDLRALCAVTTAHGVKLLVDESTGGHLRWHPQLATDAMTAGADAVLTSLTTLLPNRSTTGLLLIRDGLCEPQRLAQAMRMTGNLPIDQSGLEELDQVASRLRHQVVGDVARTVDLARVTRSMLARVVGIKVVSAADLALPVHRVDPCRILVDVRGRDMSGHTAERVLRTEYGIAAAGVDSHHIHLVIGPDSDFASSRRLVLAIASLGSWAGRPARRSAYPLAELPPAGPATMTPRQAWFADSVSVPLHGALGRTCAELVTAFPPGVPILAPGEVVTADAAAWLMDATACGVRLAGCDDPTMATVRVVASE